MYEKIGVKIKLLAVIMFALMAGAGAIVGIVFLAQGRDRYVAPGLICLFGGPLFGWLSSWTLYGFGELIDKVCGIADKLGVPQPPKPQRAPYQQPAAYQQQAYQQQQAAYQQQQAAYQQQQAAYQQQVAYQQQQAATAAADVPTNNNQAQ